MNETLITKKQFAAATVVSLLSPLLRLLPRYLLSPAHRVRLPKNAFNDFGRSGGTDLHRFISASFTHSFASSGSVSMFPATARHQPPYFLSTSASAD